MLDAEYKSHMQKLVMCADVIEHVPFDELLEMLEHADGIGPFIDPTAWMKGHHNIEPQRKLVSAGRAFAASLREAREALLHAQP